jgi:hypothetical protein
MPLDDEVPTPHPLPLRYRFVSKVTLVRSNLQAAAFRAGPRSGVRLELAPFKVALDAETISAAMPEDDPAFRLGTQSHREA